VVRGSYENLGITLAELLAIPSVNAQQLKQLVQITGLDEVAERASRKQSSILVSGHVANWEYVAMAAGLVVGAPITIVTHPQRNTIVDGLLNSYRSKFGNILVPMHDAARALLGTIRQGGVVAFLVDQHAVPERDPWIEFFGRATPTYSAPAALALRFGVPMYFGVADRHEDGTYHVHVRPVPMADLGNDQASIIELTTRHVRMLEHAIRRNPRLWSWQHRRWRDPKPPTTAHDENRHANTGKENP
jgi:KDO2-lipid IV(A) lauroyltransferase